MDDATLLVQAPSNESAQDYGYLSLLARVKKALNSAREIAVLATDIRPFPDQPRKYFNPESVRRLADSIDAGGQTTSGMIREKVGTTRYELIDGERRWRGVLLIPENRRPLYKAKLIDADDEVVQYLISGIANFNREGHTALEVMETIDRLVGFELPMKEIASLLGISEHWASQIHGLKRLAPEVRRLLDPNLPKQQQLPVMAAVQISKIEARLQLGLADRVISRDITLGRLRGEVIKVAHKEGAHIRVREVSPLKKWESLGNKVEVVSRSAGDALEILKSGEINRILRAHPTETQAILRKLKKAKEIMSQLETLIHRVIS